MEHERKNSDSHQSLLRQQSSTLSDHSVGSSPTVVASPPSPVFNRPGYHKVASATEEDTSYHGADPPHQDEPGASERDFGLGIANLDSQRRASIPTTPVGGKDSPTSSGFADPLISPTSSRLGGKLYSSMEDHWRSLQEGNTYHASNPSLHQSFIANSERERLRTKNPSSNTVQSFEPLGCDKNFSCKPRKPVEKGRGNWLAVTILLLSLYSTVFSAIWLFIAIKKPRYGHTITTAGSMTPNTANILCTAFAKSIELSFITVFVAFIGQILSTRALVQPKGITIAEMSMRSWVMQPGTMIAHWESVRYAAATMLGAATLLAALMAMIYTTASDALVSPKLKLSNLEQRLIYGKVATTFANKQYVEAQCTTPISVESDPVNRGPTCIEIQHSGQAYHNYMQYLGTWTENIGDGNSSDNMAQRPDPVGMLYDNTTVKGTWINVQNMTELSKQYNRTVNNVTMVMPHSGVFAAARDPLNDIVQPQPQGFSGLGEYYIQASVPSPYVNVMCASLGHAELIPLVYNLWPSNLQNGTIHNTITWPDDFNLTMPSSQSHTGVDDLFGFDDTQIHPIFPKLPKPFNIVFNYSTVYGQESIYLLATSADSTYTMCSMKASLTPNCSTEYHSSVSGGSLNSNCNETTNHMIYTKSSPKAPHGIWEKDWVDVASEWGMALSLNDGITDGQSTNARLLTQMIPTSNALNPSLPSTSEALAVLAGNTLVLSALGSPFIHYWNYSTPTLAEPQYQAFNATLRISNYASGGTAEWQGVFYIVLTLVFIINLLCLIYFGVKGSRVTDFMEPQNMFALSLNSPPSAVLGGTCGAGPEKEHYRTNWHIHADRKSRHLYVVNSNPGGAVHKRSVSQQTDYEMEASPMARMYTKLSQKKTSFL